MAKFPNLNGPQGHQSLAKTPFCIDDEHVVLLVALWI
jgi:hypothetical protein